MPSVAEMLAARAKLAVEATQPDIIPRIATSVYNPPTLVERVYVPYTPSGAPRGLVEAMTVDPWSKAGKYSLSWVYFCIIILVFTIMARLYNIWTDKIRTALFAAQVHSSSVMTSPPTHYEMAYLDTDKSTNKLFPRDEPAEIPTEKPIQSSISSINPLNNTIAIIRYIFYRPIPDIRFLGKRFPAFTFTFPSLAVVTISFIALTYSTLYTFVPQPLYWQSIAYGSPPVAIRAGMISVAMMPWIVALSMKANLISLITGIGHERLNVLHRWGGWLCLFLALIHTVPFYVQPVTDKGGYKIFRSLFTSGIYIYGTGWAALGPLLFLCLHSLPILRHWMYELFVALHVPVSIVFLGTMFWHCNNYLTSWNYLFATMAIWVAAYLYRLFYLNWTNFMRLSWLIGDEASVVLMHENAVKVTIPTQVKWRPGQYIYLRMPGVSVFENHPFTIASLCSEDFPSEYGEEYRDMVIVFRPFSGFTKKMLNSAIEKGPWHSYRAFIDGPYGGMTRSMDAFDHVVLIAGGSGITALVSHLLDLIKRMRDGRAVTKSIQVIWALKRPEVMEWFKEELRICREFAPPDSVRCQFFITAAKRLPATGQLVSAQTPSRPMSNFFHDKVNDAFMEIANKRTSHYSDISAHRHSALIRDEAAGDAEREKELRRENEDGITALPQAHLIPQRGASLAANSLEQPKPVRSIQEKRHTRNLSLDIETAVKSGGVVDPPQSLEGFNFGFPSTPTEFQKNLMRFAFLPAQSRRKDGWSTEYGRPDVPYMLRQLNKNFGRRTMVFVCGPPSMRVDVANTVAELQKDVWQDPDRDELFLHTENYAI